MLLVATGRRPNSDLLDVAATGVSTKDSGHVVVDEYQRTGVDGIYALGDISSMYELKHVANHEERVVQHNLLNPDPRRGGPPVRAARGVQRRPRSRQSGLTEEEARRRA